MHDWFQLRDGFEGCSFINVLLELGRITRSGRRASPTSTTCATSCAGAPPRRADRRGEFASSWHILMKGAIVLAAVGDADAALRARKMGSALIGEHRPISAADPGEAVS